MTPTKIVRPLALAALCLGLAGCNQYWERKDSITLSAGDAVAFGGSYVHDVLNVRTQTAVSVHAYSPPLTHMNFYDVVDGQLTTLAKIWTDDPEVATPDLRAAS